MTGGYNDEEVGGVVPRKTQVELTNMCLVYDEHRILVQEKKGTGYAGGSVFPGGHIEQGESLRRKTS